MDVCVVSEKTFLSSVEEVGSVVDASLLAWSTAKDLGLPCIKMAVKVNDTDWTICTFGMSALDLLQTMQRSLPVDRTQQWKCNGMVTSKCDKSRQGRALLGRARLVCMSVWWAAQKKVVAFFDLLKSIRVVVPCHVLASV